MVGGQNYGWKGPYMESVGMKDGQTPHLPELESTVGNMETPTENESTLLCTRLLYHKMIVWFGFSLTISSNWFCVKKLLQLSGLAALLTLKIVIQFQERRN